MKGKNFLKVTGILMIIFSAIAILLGIILLIGVAGLDYLSNGLYSSGVLYFSCVLMLVSAGLEMAAGIIGIKNCDKPHKAVSCLVMGILVIAMSVAGNILYVVGGMDFNVGSFLLGLVMPVLYIIGALLNRQSINA